MSQARFFSSAIEQCSALAAEMRIRHFVVDSIYVRGDDQWKIIAGPSRPETPPLDFDGQAMYLDATEVIIPVGQPEDCLQFVQDGSVVFEPRVGDRIRFAIGGVATECKIVERGDRPCWFFLFGNKEIQVFVEKYRL